MTTAEATPVHVPTLDEEIGTESPSQAFKYLKALIYGEPGAGKTYLFGTVEDMPDEFLPALLIDIDGGVATIRHRARIRTKRIHSIENLQDLYKKIAAQSDYYKCIGVDNLSELQKIDMNEVMVDAK